MSLSANDRSSLSNRLLTEACAVGDFDKAKEALEGGADPDTTYPINKPYNLSDDLCWYSNGQSVLNAPRTFACPNMVHLLLDYKADVHAPVRFMSRGMMTEGTALDQIMNTLRASRWMFLKWKIPSDEKRLFEVMNLLIFAGALPNKETTNKNHTDLLVVINQISLALMDELGKIFDEKCLVSLEMLKFLIPCAPVVLNPKILEQTDRMT